MRVAILLAFRPAMVLRDARFLIYALSEGSRHIAFARTYQRRYCAPHMDVQVLQ
jgi:hypothetical protein